MAGQKILVVVGPTSSGKTTLSIELAKRLNGEIISADSRQVYRGLDIGTGKVTKRETQGVRHHLLDVASPTRTFTAYDFANLGRVAMHDIAARGKLPIIAGGTGFYVDALLGRISLPDVKPNAKLRSALSKKSAAQLFAMLQKRDPKKAHSLSSLSERNNKVRLIRALEIAAAKVAPSRSEKRKPSYDVLWVGLSVRKEMLEKKIRARLNSRLKRGMIAESRRLHATGLSYKRMQALGLEYRALAALLQSRVSRKEMKERLAFDIIHYAKRQRTYWKMNPQIRWFDPSKRRSIERLVKEWLGEDE